MKTVKVRIALEINPDGDWQAAGNRNTASDFDRSLIGFPDLNGDVRRHWIEAEVPVPAEDAEVIAGKAVEVEAA